MIEKVREAIRRLSCHGFTVVTGGSGHYKVYLRDKMVAVFSKNMGSKRGWKNVVSHIKRETGIEVR